MGMRLMIGTWIVSMVSIGILSVMRMLRKVWKQKDETPEEENEEW